MKKLLLLLTATLILSSCSNEQKAKKVIKEYLSKNMNDFKSYEPIEFLEIEPIYSHRYESVPDAEEILRDSIGMSKMFSSLSDPDTVKKYNIIMDELMAPLREAEKNHVPKLLKYEITHRFRGKNLVGTLVLNQWTFYLDKDLTEVIDVNQNN